MNILNIEDVTKDAVYVATYKITVKNGTLIFDPDGGKYKGKTDRF